MELSRQVIKYIFSTKWASFLHGQSLIELLMAIAFSGIVLPAIITAFVSSHEGKAQQEKRVDAALLFTQAIEAVRSVREADWSNIAVNGTYHPLLSGSTWQLAPENEVIYGFTRSVVIADVFRDAAGAIVSSGGKLDYSTKKVIITVSWTKPYTSSLSTTEYFSRYLGNAGNIQTTDVDFNAGTGEGTAVTKTDNGEVVLAPHGKGDWCDPNLSITSVDLPKSGVANAISAVIGNVVSGTGENSSGVSFASVDVDNNHPPDATVSGTFDGYKTNDVFTDGNYAYIATDNNAKEVVILDLNQLDPITKKYAELGYFNISGNLDAESVFVVPGSPDIGFVTASDNTLRTFNLQSKIGSRSQLASKVLAGKGVEMVVFNGYAYVAIAGATQEMQIVSYNNIGTVLSITGYADVNGQAATSIAMNTDGSRAYLATAADASKKELFIVNTSAKTGNRPIIGSFEASGMNPTGVAVATYLKLVLVGHGGEEYKVINIVNEAVPVYCGGLNIDSGANGVATVSEPDSDSYAYTITGDATSELKIIEGGPGGIYTTEGIFTSSIIDLGEDVAVNALHATVTKPSGTDVQFQIAVAKAVAGSCASADFFFVGPDGTGSTYFPSIGGVIPVDQDGTGYENPGRCIHYRAVLTSSDSEVTPVISEVGINYSP
ncbi:MAG: hypothetical protein HYV40_02705 [Candidatus Levybacteria bacterium]|nr:hypothetical protein [Candidatus Levybacteria bacterium]